MTYQDDDNDFNHEKDDLMDYETSDCVEKKNYTCILYWSRLCQDQYDRGNSHGNQNGLPTKLYTLWYDRIGHPGPKRDAKLILEKAQRVIP